MPIVSTDIHYRLSGGSSNSNVNASLGGAKSSTQMVDNTLNNLFDNVTGDESSAGDVEYRCIYVHNAHATLTWYGVKLWIVSNTPSEHTTVDIGLGTSTVTGTEQSVVNENTAPVTATFSAPSTKETALTIGDLAPGEHKAVWIRRTVTAGAAAYNNDGCTIRAEGDTAA